MKRWSLFTLLFILAALLAACGSLPPAERTYTESEVVDALNGLIDDVQSVTDLELTEALIATAQLPVNRPNCPTLDDIFELITFTSAAPNSQALTALAGTMLARGSYVYDSAADMCSSAADTDNLVLRYPYQTAGGAVAEAELVVDWDVDSSTITVADPAGDLAEVPTDMNVMLTVNGESVADVEVALSWYNAPECGTRDGILEPTSVSISGDIGSLSFDDLGYRLSEGSLNVQGGVQAAAGISTDFELSVNGELTRDSCFIDTFKVDTGKLSIGVDSTVTEDSHNFQLDVGLSDVIFTDFSDVGFGEVMLGDFQGIASVQLSDGALQIDDVAAASFSGVLDDSNDNGVSGENVTIEFSAGGSTTLEDFLTDNDFGVMPLPPFDD